MKQFLYLHSEITDPNHALKAVSIVETPELADCLAAQGMVATAVPRDWCQDHVDALKGRHVVLFPTGDGGRFMDFAAAVWAVAKTVRLVELGMTVQQWFDRGGNREGLQEAAGKVRPLVGPAAGQVAGSSPGDPASSPAPAPRIEPGAAAHGAETAHSEMARSEMARSGPDSGAATGTDIPGTNPPQADLPPAAAQSTAQPVAGIPGDSRPAAERTQPFITTSEFPSTKQACLAAADLLRDKARQLDPLDWLLLVKGIVFDFERTLLRDSKAA